MVSNLTKDQAEEIQLCAEDFLYFCDNYVHFDDTNLDMYNYKRRLVNHLEENQFTIFSKFRAGGFTTLLSIYGLWKCLFQLDQNIFWVSNNTAQSNFVCDLVKEVIESLPGWLIGEVSKMVNNNEKKFKETNSNMYFHSSVGFERLLGSKISLLIVDEANHINNLDYIWRQLFPTLRKDSGCVLMGTVNRDTDWFYGMLEDSKEGKNTFKAYECEYTEHPLFDSEWERKMKTNLGEAWRTDYLQIPISSKRGRGKMVWRSLFDE